MDGARVREISLSLCHRYPRFVRRVTAGVSVRGQEIPALVFQTFDGGSCQRVMLAGAFHGTEWITSLIILRLCESLLLSCRSRQPLCGLSPLTVLREREIWFVPMVNPDGVSIAGGMGGPPRFWKANARGVDINRNFDAGWSGVGTPGAAGYGGKRPESEPETRMLTSLCRRCGFRHVVALHTQGEEIYWRYGKRTPPQSRLMAEILASVSGYRVTDPSPDAAHGGFKDWFIDSFGRPGFTIELGRGSNPLPLSGFESLYADVQEMLLLSLLL